MNWVRCVRGKPGHRTKPTSDLRPLPPGRKSHQPPSSSDSMGFWRSVSDECGWSLALFWQIKSLRDLSPLLKHLTVHGDSLVVRWLVLSAVTAGVQDLIPGQGTKILQATWHGLIIVIRLGSPCWLPPCFYDKMRGLKFQCTCLHVNHI